MDLKENKNDLEIENVSKTKQTLKFIWFNS